MFPQQPAAGPDERRRHDTATKKLLWSLDIEPDIVAEVRAERAALVRGETEIAPIRSHEPLQHLLKLSGLFALLDDRWRIERNDWELAQQMWACSLRVHDHLHAAVEDQQRATEQARTRAYAEREAHAQLARARVDTNVEHVQHRILEILLEEARPSSMCAIKRRLSAAQRALLEPAITGLCAAGDVIEDDAGNYRPSSPNDS